MAWNRTGTTDTTSVSGSVTTISQIRDNWNFLNLWWDVEHQTFASAGAGTHTAGKAGSLLVAPYTQIAAATSPGTGAWGYDITNGVALLGPSWAPLTSAYSCLRYVLTPQSIPTLQWTPLTGGVASGSPENFDVLGEFTTLTCSFVLLSAGYYYVKGVILWPTPVASEYTIGAGLAKNGALVTKDTIFGGSVKVIEVADIVSGGAGDSIQLAGYHSYTIGTSAIQPISAWISAIRVS